jgi:uncharacterized membrane protein (DUF4010 family)
MPDPVLINLLQRLALAFGVGFLIGVERGWKHREAPDGARAAGLRTHAVIGLLGGVCGALLPYVGQIGFAALTLAFGAILVAFKWRESERDNDVSATGAIAALLVFALGVYAMCGNMVVTGAAAVALAGVLAFKEALHTWLDKLTWKELRSALLILAATVIALPLLPDRTVDIWHAINPRELWLLTILVAGASFAGYVAVRVLGQNVGLLAGAAAGALVSSTVVTAELGRRVKDSDARPAPAAAAAALAAAVSVLRVIALASVAATAALGEVIAPLLGAAVAFTAAALALRLLDRDPSPGRDHKLESPLDVLKVAQFALLLGGLIVVGRIVGDHYGQAGVLPLAATVGLGDVDSVTLATGSLMRGGLAANIGAHAILVAVLMNTLAKGVIGLLTGGWRFALYYCAAAGVAAAFGAAGWFLAAPMIAPMFG